jgi:hypothetical protein
LYFRAFKKCSKAIENHQIAMKKYQEIMSIENPSLELLESCPNVDAMEIDVNKLKSRVSDLARLEEGLLKIKSVTDPKFPELKELADLLEVTDSPPPPAPRGEKKPKGKPSGPRMPYHVFTSHDKIEIRVGRSAADNDLLSCDPNYRDG